MHIRKYHSYYYDVILKKPEIIKILANVPKNELTLSDENYDILKAYYIYVELGKILREDPDFLFREGLYMDSDLSYHYEKPLSESFYGVCKQMSEVYALLLNEVGIEAEVYNEDNDGYGHVETAFWTHGKFYICNLIEDVARIQAGRRPRGFAYDMIERRKKTPEIAEKHLTKLKRWVDMHYKTMDGSQYESIPRRGQYDSLYRLESWGIDDLNAAIGYGRVYEKQESKSKEVLTEDDVLMLYSKEFHTPEFVKEYVFNGEDVPERDVTERKLDYIFSHINEMTTFNTEKMEYIERIKYYGHVIKYFLEPEERKRITPYVITVGNDYRQIISIIRLAGMSEEDPGAYYLFSDPDNQYRKISRQNLRNFLENMKKEHDLHYVGINYFAANWKEKELKLELEP